MTCGQLQRWGAEEFLGHVKMRTVHRSKLGSFELCTARLRARRNCGIDVGAMNIENAPTHLPVQEAADLYGVSGRSLFLLMAQGRLTRHRRASDRRTFCSIEELDRLFKPAEAEPRHHGPRRAP